MNELDTLKEELFCVKYELDTFSEIMLEGKAERWLPYFTGSIKDENHLDRYYIACKYVAGLKVLDIACGAGKGSYTLATKGNAASVIGGDIDRNAVRYARHRFIHPNVSFAEIDGLKLDYSNEFDVIVSFETIEHIADFEKFLQNIWRALKPGARFIVSTPISSQPFDTKPLNPYHTQEWGFTQFQDVLRKSNFDIEKIFTQLDLKLGGPSLFQRLKKRLLYKKENIRHFTGYDEKKIEEYNGQYNASEFGTRRNGFQIAVCKKVNAH
jgi:2-polyprenyl-3-methyl-5-hydroxy-6-metoxy-1,4-benzoquinol methylase